MSMVPYERVAVLGCGTMGSGIAQVVAQSGRQVIVLEHDADLVARGLDRIGRFLDDGVARGKVTPDERHALLGRITGTASPGDLEGVDLVIEAVTENPDIKSAIWRTVADAVGQGAVLTSNTSAMSVTGLAAGVPNPSRFAGLHFFNPAPLMALVEVVRAMQTAPAVVDELAEFCVDIGKEPVVVDDRPGFLVNRMLMPFLNDVLQAFDDDLATAEDIDRALELGLGHKIGPLRLLDMIGLDVHHAATISAYEQTLDPVYAPPPLLTQMVLAGFHGDKAGAGLRSPSDNLQRS